MLNHQEAIVLGAQAGGDLGELDTSQVMDLGLDSAEVVASAVEGTALPTRASNLLQLLEFGLGRLGELAAGDTVVGVGLLVVLVVIGHRQSLDKGQVACHDVGRGGSDSAGESNGEELHFILDVVCVGRRMMVLLVVVEMMEKGRKGVPAFILGPAL